MRRLISLGAALLSCSSAAWAQTLWPMKAQVTTFSDQAAIRINVKNPYTLAKRFDVEVFNTDFTPLIGARLSQASLPVAPSAASSVFVIAPMDGQAIRDFYVCVSTRPFAGGGNGIRGQVCGRYRAVQRTY